MDDGNYSTQFKTLELALDIALMQLNNIGSNHGESAHIDLIEPGVYPDMSFGDYMKLKIPSSSSIKTGLDVSMAHMRAQVEGKLESKDTTARRFGRAFHAYVLEPERFKTDWKIQKHCNATIGSGARKGQKCSNWGIKIKDDDGLWYCGAHGKGEGFAEAQNIVTGAELTDIQGAGAALEKRPIINTLRQLGFAEYSIVVEIAGVMVKVRYDYYALSYQGSRTIVDIKKIGVASGSNSELRNQIRKLHYDLQGSLYLEAHRQHFGEDAKFLWLFVEDGYPHHVIPRFMSPAMEQLGRAKMLPTLERWRQCVEAGEFPGYTQEPEEIEPDEYELTKYGVA